MELRKKAATLIGYETWADYVIEPKMAKTGKTAQDFLDDLFTKIKPIGLKERDALLELKKQDCKDLGIEYDPAFYAWDYRYLDRLYVEKNLDLDDEKVKEYLPAQAVVKEMLIMYQVRPAHTDASQSDLNWGVAQNIFSVDFIPMEDQKTWHPEVTVFSVWNKPGIDVEGDAERSFLGYLYLDLYPRDNKYGHAAVWGLIPSFKLEDGSKQYSTSAMVANLASQ